MKAVIFAVFLNKIDMFVHIFLLIRTTHVRQIYRMFSLHILPHVRYVYLTDGSLWSCRHAEGQRVRVASRVQHLPRWVFVAAVHCGVKLQLGVELPLVQALVRPWSSSKPQAPGLWQHLLHHGCNEGRRRQLQVPSQEQQELRGSLQPAGHVQRVRWAYYHLQVLLSVSLFVCCVIPISIWIQEFLKDSWDTGHFWSLYSAKIRLKIRLRAPIVPTKGWNYHIYYN